MATEAVRRTPPYGPAKGMLEGLRLLQRTSPSIVDQELLRSHGIARGNEYKVVGALRYLGLIDEEGRPTERARLLKARGAVQLLNLQQIVRDAYPTLFRKLDLRAATRDDIYNHFLADLGLQPEMAAKATRFFLELARAAGFQVGIERADSHDERTAELRRTAEPGSASRRTRTAQPRAVAAEGTRSDPPALSLVLPAEALSMSEEELAGFFGRLIRAWRTATA
ncbi:MAG: DUF5343 domain-containing protein [Chloroflexota bacterium]|nr:DUF5343 domain-containing protein [Dehalococcoidia bacterium]MDW8252587.1 DUF5343 domain-containing protein [Chloroflexota bacterium]